MKRLSRSPKFLHLALLRRLHYAGNISAVRAKVLGRNLYNLLTKN